MPDDLPGQRSGHGATSVLKHLADAQANPAAEVRPPFDRAAHTILVVDDQPAGLYAASRFLQVAGYRTLEASDGSEALAKAPQASAVLLDVNLPDIHGVQVCSDLRREAATRDMPVVLISAVYVDDLHRDAALSAGADAYLVAPPVPDELTATFDRLLAAAPRG